MKTTNDDTRLFREENNLISDIYRDENFNMPVRYVLGLTNECNLNCPFCFLEKHCGKFKMGLDDWKQVTDQLPDYSRVILFGGEPMFYNHFDEIYSYIANKFRCTIVTNGTLLTQKKVDVLLEADKLEDIAVSIDCIGNYNRDFTKRQWTRLVDGIKSYNEKRKHKANKPKLGAACVLLDETAHDLFDTHRFLHEELECDYVTYCTLNGTEMQLCDKMRPYDSLNIPEAPPNYKNWDVIMAMLEKIRHYNQARDIKSYFRPKIIDFNQAEELDKLNILNTDSFNKSSYGACKIPWSDCRIYGDGSVTNCLGLELGNFKRNGDLRSILAGPVSRSFKADLKKNKFFEKCSRCVFLYDKQFSYTPNEKSK
ncbi:radical SAM protein [Thalassomonas sp. RHCl1]|uniref:radical SAM protein n=1 Tax=Thalassomonas sp. RHCl1 TaxID=2995320 RepID=UPI00248CFD9D|nr:radical SAM protein [Thalassomonas sp. RHCl1]